ncbi:unnamed protein product [Boreogadus saida]
MSPDTFVGVLLLDAITERSICLQYLPFSLSLSLSLLLSLPLDVAASHRFLCHFAFDTLDNCASPHAVKA